MQALEEQLEEVKSTLVLEDQDMEALEKIQDLLEDNRSSLKDLKWMCNLFVLTPFICVIMLSPVLFSFCQSIKKTLFSAPSFFFFII